MKIPTVEEAQQWLDAVAPVDDTPPFGDESLRDSPNYQLTHIMYREEIPDLLVSYVKHLAGD